MKKDFQSIVGNLSKVALAAGILFSAQSFAMKAEQVLELQAEVPAQGRATLTVEDLQTLLGLKSRDPSSKGLNQQQDVVDSAATFNMSISEKEKGRIIREISKLSIKRDQLMNELSANADAEVNSLRQKRRAIQLSRTRAASDDTKFGRQLFSSLLAESNAKASVNEALKEFDRTHAIEIQYSLNSDGQRNVAAIKLGTQLVWQNTNSDQMLAQNSNR